MREMFICVSLCETTVSEKKQAFIMYDSALKVRV